MKSDRITTDNWIGYIGCVLDSLNWIRMELVWQKKNKFFYVCVCALETLFEIQTQTHTHTETNVHKCWNSIEAEATQIYTHKHKQIQMNPTDQTD